MLYNGKPIIFLVVVLLLKGKLLHSQTVKRNHLQILTEILSVCREPQVISHVMHETDTSLKKLQFCFKELMKQGMVVFHHRKRTYVTTEKGLRYLQVWANLKC